MIAKFLATARATIIPPWAKWLAFLVLLSAVYGMGRLHEARRGADAHAEYVSKQASQTVFIVKRQVEVVAKIETKWRDRIQKVYIKGDEIEKQVPVYITRDDDARFGVNAGFVRNHDAAWSGELAKPGSDADREPAGIPLSVIGEVEASNATACRAWREQALGWRDFYAKQQIAINGKAGDWFKATPD
jgi:hypothetical protein